MSQLQQASEDDNQVKYVILNHGLDNSSEWVQYVNRLVSLVLSIVLHCYIFSKLVSLNKLRLMNDYQILILVQSAINILAYAFELILNEIQTENIQFVKIGHPFWQFSLSEKLFYTIFMALLSNTTQDFLMLFNLHRLVLIKQEEYKIAVTNYGLTDKYEWFQFTNRILSQFMCIWLHLSIICRLLVVNRFRVKSDYQILIIVQSAINVAACIFEMIVNEIQTQNWNYIKIGHPFWHFSMNERLVYILAMNTSSTSSQDILMLFNLHRLFIIKKKRLLILYAIAIPLMLTGPIGDAYTSYPVIMAGRDVDQFFRVGQVPVIAVVIIICYTKLKKEFATNPSFSEKTKRLQQKLSWSIMMQLILLCAISLIITVIPFLVDTFLPDLYQKYSVSYLIYSLVITQWYSFLSASFIAWSIAGFFKNMSPPTTIQHSDVKIFQVEPQKPGARKQSTKLSLV